MSEINRAAVAHLARLAHIEMTAEELDKMAGELDVIVDSIKSVQRSCPAEVPATSHPIPLTNVFREDVVGETLTPRNWHWRTHRTPPTRRFKVPAILDEE